MSKSDTRKDNKENVVSDTINTKKEVIPRTFYINPEHVKALAFEKAGTGKDLSEIVREALNDYFGEEIEKYK